MIKCGYMKTIAFTIILFLSSVFLFAQGNINQTELSTLEFFETYIEKLDDSQKNLTYARKKNHFARMGTETINGEISGTLFYTVKIKGMGAQVIFRYTNFSVEEGWTFDGEITVTSDINQNGNFGGTITVSGKYPAKIIYDDLKLADGYTSAGNYIIEYPNKVQEKVPYTEFLKVAEKLGLE